MRPRESPGLRPLLQAPLCKLWGLPRKETYLFRNLIIEPGPREPSAPLREVNRPWTLRFTEGRLFH